MKAFELSSPSRLRLTKVTPRKELHGDERVQAVSLRVRLDTSNDVLHKLHPGLLDMLFFRAADDAGQPELDGVPETKPNLRCPLVKQPLKLDGYSLSGYTMTIEHGIDDTTALQLYVCELDKFEVEATEGGSVGVIWSVASNKEITPELVGALCDLEGAEIVATQTAPKEPAPVIDGTTAAFKKDHPDAPGFDFDADREASEVTPESAFAAAVAADDGAAEQAEIEAGMTASVEKARKAKRAEVH